MIPPRFRPLPSILLALVALADGALAAPALVAIDDPVPGLASRLLASDVTVVRDRPSGILALVDPEEDAVLDRMRLRWRELDPDVTGRTYYVVAVPALDRLDDVREEVPVLDASGHEAVIAAGRDVIERIAGRGLELERVFLRPVVPPRPTPAAPRLSGEPLPLVEEMVARVVSDSIDAHVAYFQGLVTRLAYTSNAFEAAQYIEDEFLSYGLDVFRHDFDPSFSPNVVGVLPGRTEPQRAILIGGHYDSIAYVGTMGAPGADDNASGTAAVLECARALAGYEFDLTLLFVGFGAEELGLVGSAYLAAAIDDFGYELDAMLNVDMCGHVEPGDFTDIDVISNTPSEWLRQHVLTAGAVYAPTIPTIASPPPSVGSSDHASFWSQGYPAIFFFEDTDRSSRYIHTDQDLIGLSYNSPELAAHTTRVATASMATLAGPLGLTVLHDPIADVDDVEAPVRVTATIVSPEPLELDSLFVHYVVESGVARAGDELRAALEPTGEGDVYEAFIPAQATGSFVRYYLSAEDVLGRRVTHPPDAPESWHRYFVGTALTLAVDDFEEDRGWTVRDAGDDATAGLWERADPVGTIAEDLMVQPEDDHTPDPGALCFVTGNGSPGGAAGASDVDGGRTTLLSPIYDLSGHDDVGLVYHRWYVNGRLGVGPARALDHDRSYLAEGGDPAPRPHRPHRWGPVPLRGRGPGRAVAGGGGARRPHAGGLRRRCHPHRPRAGAGWTARAGSARPAGPEPVRRVGHDRADDPGAGSPGHAPGGGRHRSRGGTARRRRLPLRSSPHRLGRTDRTGGASRLGALPRPSRGGRRAADGEAGHGTVVPRTPEGRGTTAPWRRRRSRSRWWASFPGPASGRSPRARARRRSTSR